MQRGILFFLFGVVVLGLLALLFVHGSDDPTLPSVAPVGEPVPHTASPEPVPPTVVPKTRPLGSDAPHVHVEVTALERFVPPPAERVFALDLADGKRLPAWPVAGTGAGFDAPSTASGMAIVAIERGNTTLLRQVALAGDAPVEVRLGGLVSAKGSVRDGNGRPVVGAALWFGDRLSDGQRREIHSVENGDLPEQNGQFEVELPAGEGVPMVVRKAGFATVWRPLRVLSPMAPLELMLQPSCTLDVQLAGAAVAMQDARLFVVPEAPVATELTVWPFFAQALDDGTPFDERGVATITDLPRAGTLRLLVRHPLAGWSRATTVVLKGERVRAIVPMAFDAASWNVRVVDEHGQPLAGVAAWARPDAQPLASSGTQRLLPPHLDLPQARAGQTRADGTCTLGAVAGGVLSLRAFGRAGRDLPANAWTNGSDVVLPTWLGGEPEFVLAPPRPGVAWHVTSNLGSGVQIAVAADQPCRVALPYAGRFDFVLTTKVGEPVLGTRTDRGIAVTGPHELAAPTTAR